MPIAQLANTTVGFVCLICTKINPMKSRGISHVKVRFIKLASISVLQPSENRPFYMLKPLKKNQTTESILCEPQKRRCCPNL